MSAGVLVDTDVLVDHLQGAARLVLPDGRVAVSVVSRAELYAGRNADEDVVRTLLAPFLELPVDRAVAERAGRIRRASGARLRDALIAATALEHGLDVMTRNGRDFERVAGLGVRRP